VAPAAIACASPAKALSADLEQGGRLPALASARRKQPVQSRMGEGVLHANWQSIASGPAQILDSGLEQRIEFVVVRKWESVSRWSGRIPRWAVLSAGWPCRSIHRYTAGQKPGAAGAGRWRIHKGTEAETRCFCRDRPITARPTVSMVAVEVQYPHRQLRLVAVASKQLALLVANAIARVAADPRLQVSQRSGQPVAPCKGPLRASSKPFIQAGKIATI